MLIKRFEHKKIEICFNIVLNLRLEASVIPSFVENIFPLPSSIRKPPNKMNTILFVAPVGSQFAWKVLPVRYGFGRINAKISEKTTAIN